MKERIVITGATILLPQQALAASHCNGDTSVIRFADDGELSALSHQRKRQTLLSALLCQECERLFNQAGLDIATVRGVGTGLVSGAYYGCMSITQGIFSTLQQKGPRGIDAIEFAKSTHSFPLSAASIKFSLLGPVVAAVSGEFAGLDALAMARDWLLHGRCQRVLVVGYEHFSPLLEKHLRETTRENLAIRYSDNLCVLLLETYSSAMVRSAFVMAELHQVTRLGGTLTTLPTRWQKMVASMVQGNAVINVLPCHPPHPAARLLENDVLANYTAPFYRQTSQNLSQTLGASPLLQLAHFLYAPPDFGSEWLLHYFAASGAGGVRLSLNQPKGGCHEI